MLRTLASTTALVALLALGAGPAGAASSPQDFIKDAVQGDNSEIMLGRQAQDRGASPKVRDFGKMLVTDHTEARQQASAVASQLGVTPSDRPASEAQDEQAKLSKLSGVEFDREFATYMVADHQKDLQMFKDESKADAGPAGTLAARQVPVLQKHLDMAQSIKMSMADNGAAAAGETTRAALRSAPLAEMSDEWRASKLVGVAIYGPDDKKIGSVTDVLIDRQGKAEAVVVGIGGFLGLGEKDVAIPFGEVSFTDQPVAPPAGGTPAATGRAGGSGMTPTTAAAPDGTRHASENGSASAAAQTHPGYPDHGVVALTVDQLKDAPTFHFALPPNG
jgi:putative membrane protein